MAGHALKKLDLNWEGPFKIVRRTKYEVYLLEGQDEKNIPPSYGAQKIWENFTFETM